MARPAFKPSDEQKRTVALFVVAGCDQDEIGECLDISRVTLRKHFRKELRTSYAKVKARLSAKLISKADGGDLQALIFYLRTHGWQERLTVTGDAAAPVVMTILSGVPRAAISDD